MRKRNCLLSSYSTLFIYLFPFIYLFMYLQFPASNYWCMNYAFCRRPIAKTLLKVRAARECDAPRRSKHLRQNRQKHWKHKSDNGLTSTYLLLKHLTFVLSKKRHQKRPRFQTWRESEIWPNESFISTGLNANKIYWTMFFLIICYCCRTCCFFNCIIFHPMAKINILHESHNFSFLFPVVLFRLQRLRFLSRQL